LFYVLKAENSAIIVGMVVFTIEELSIVEGYFFGLDVSALFLMVEAEEPWQQHFFSTTCGQLTHFLYLLVDFFILCLRI
jgi:hypothetical protein